MCGETGGFWPENWEWVPVCVGEISSLQCDGYPSLHRLRHPFVNEKLFPCAIVDVLATLASCSLGYPLDKDKLVLAPESVLKGLLCLLCVVLTSFEQG